MRKLHGVVCLYVWSCECSTYKTLGRPYPALLRIYHGHRCTVGWICRYLYY